MNIPEEQPSPVVLSVRLHGALNLTDHGAPHNAYFKKLDTIIKVSRFAQPTLVIDQQRPSTIIFNKYNKISHKNNLHCLFVWWLSRCLVCPC